MDHLSCTPQFWVENDSSCTEHLQDETVWNSIPLINANELHEFKDNALVRFHGMIQDMYNPEFYFEQYEVENEDTKEKSVKCGKYRDTTDLSDNEFINFDSSENKTGQRHTLVVISVPGLNDWVHNIEKEHHGITKTPDAENLAPNKSVKRAAEDDEEMEIEELSSECKEKKKICAENKNESTGIVSKDHILNFPLPEQRGKCCHIKVYGNYENFKLNEMIDIIGFLSVSPMLIDSNYHNDEHGSELEIQTHNPPPSLVPRIHCVSYKKRTFYNPLIRHISLEADLIFNLKKELSIVFSQLLLGDKLAADYLICHLISAVYLRKDLMALGKFSLNLSNIPAEKIPDFGEKLNQILQLLVPKSHYLPMTLDNMNDLTFTPKKDYDCNRLTSGVLQLSNNTHLILDETKLQPGQLNASGCKAVAALTAAIKNQKVHYDFNYYQMEFDCDIPVLILSEGTSLLPSDVHVPLNLDEHCVSTYSEIVEAAQHFLKPDLLNNLRVYLTKTRHSNYDLSDNVLELVQNEFVKMRNENANITADDLHQLLVLARLICLSSGRESLDEVSWQEACQMETERKARVAKLPRRK